MFRVAVTGGIGSGKSVVCSVFEKLGIPVFYADFEARLLMDTNETVKKKIINSFGIEVYDENFKLNRSKFAQIIFNNKEALLTANGIIHPEVRIAFNNWAEKQRAPYVIQEAALIFESGQASSFEKIILVTAPVEERIRRVAERDKTSREKVLERINNQMDEKLKLEQSDFIILNNGKEMLIPQILNIHNSLV